jgi:hypothetical protein
VNTTHLLAQTGCHQYLIRRTDLLTIRTVSAGGTLTIDDPQGRPCALAELGPLLDPDDVQVLPRRRALIVSLRRRLVALLIDAIDEIDQPLLITPLPSLISARLSQSLVIGAAVIGADVTVQLDLRAVAMTAARQAAEGRTR